MPRLDARPARRRHVPCDPANEGRFTGPVLAGDGNDLAGLDPEIGAAERVKRTETHAGPLDAQERQIRGNG